jgi:Fur family peroxide stress response transcriptional regulator
MYQTILKENGLKATHQRLAILSEIEKYGHVQIETLYESIHTLYPTLALGTLYRNINELKEKNIIQEVHVNNSKVYYETIKEKHHHFTCKECGMIEDIQLDAEPIHSSVTLPKGSSVDRIDVMLYGTCDKCASH